MISVSDGTASASLPAFSLAVLQVATGTATVSWTPPTTNTDGSALTDLAGYRVAYGRAATELDQSAAVDNAGLTHLHGGQSRAGHVVLRGRRGEQRRRRERRLERRHRRRVN